MQHVVTCNHMISHMMLDVFAGQIYVCKITCVCVTLCVFARYILLVFL